jgi:hypothetical protein
VDVGCTGCYGIALEPDLPNRKGIAVFANRNLRSPPVPPQLRVFRSVSRRSTLARLIE